MYILYPNPVSLLKQNPEFLHICPKSVRLNCSAKNLSASLAHSENCNCQGQPLWGFFKYKLRLQKPFFKGSLLPSSLLPPFLFFPIYFGACSAAPSHHYFRYIVVIS